MKRVVGDLEADSLYNWKTGEKPSTIWCGVFEDLDTGVRTSFVNDTCGYAAYGALPMSYLPSFLDGYDLVYMHNLLGYDWYLLSDQLNYQIPIEKCRDTFVLSKFGNNTKYYQFHPRRRMRHSVEAWAKWLGLEQQKVEHEDWSRFTPEMLHRCETDVTIQVAITRTVIKELANTPEYAIDLEMRFAQYLQEQHINGFYCDRPKALALLKEYEKEVASLEEEIQKEFPPKRVLEKAFKARFKKRTAGQIKKGLAEDDPVLMYSKDIEFLEKHGLPLTTKTYDHYVDVPFNIGSPPQRVERLLEVGWEPLEMTPAGNPKSPKADCPSLEGEGLPPEVKLFGKYLIKLSRVLTIRQWLDAMDVRGYVHCTIDPIGTWTYRSSHRDPNLGNVSSRASDAHLLRSCWRVEDEENRVLVGADASGIQSRAMAHYIAEATGDFTYVDVVSDPDIDIHVYNQEAAGIASRKEAKTFYYQFLLGGGYFKTGKIFKIPEADYEGLLEYMRENGIRSTLDASMSFTKTPLTDKNFAIATRGYQVKNDFIKKVPGLEEFRDGYIKERGTKGFVTLIDGRHTAVESDYNVMAALLQGFETVVMRRTLVATSFILKSRNIPFWARNYIHDESQMETVPKHAEEVGDVFKEQLVYTGKKLNSLCPLDAEALCFVRDKDENIVEPKVFTTDWSMTH